MIGFFAVVHRVNNNPAEHTVFECEKAARLRRPYLLLLSIDYFI
jgi:hypothetical protein